MYIYVNMSIGEFHLGVSPCFSSSSVLHVLSILFGWFVRSEAGGGIAAVLWDVMFLVVSTIIRWKSVCVCVCVCIYIYIFKGFKLLSTPKVLKQAFSKMHVIDQYYSLSVCVYIDIYVCGKQLESHKYV